MRFIVEKQEIELDNLVSGTSSKLDRQRAGWQRRNTRREVLLLWLLLVSSLGQVALEAWRRRGHVAVLGRRDHAPQRPSVEHQHRWTSLQPWITALALPVTVAGLAQGNVPVRVVVAQSCRTETYDYVSFDQKMNWLMID